MNFELGINVVFCGLAIVFLMLLILIAVMYVFGAFSKTAKKAVTDTAIVQNTASTVPVVADGVDDETVAVITAAIYCLYSGSNIVPKISFIKPAQCRPAWAKAGIAQNTKAF